MTGVRRSAYACFCQPPLCASLRTSNTHQRSARSRHASEEAQARSSCLATRLFFSVQAVHENQSPERSAKRSAFEGFAQAKQRSCCHEASYGAASKLNHVEPRSSPGPTLAELRYFEAASTQTGKRGKGAKGVFMATPDRGFPRLPSQNFFALFPPQAPGCWQTDRSAHQKPSPAKAILVSSPRTCQGQSGFLARQPA